MNFKKQDLERFPQDIKDEIADTLKVYDKVYITFMNGKYNVSTGVAIKKTYAIDEKFIGAVCVEDIYTLEERTQNYISAFNSYPIWYKGKKDYSKL